MKLYKLISSNYKSMNGGDFDWSDYLPKGSEPGKWTPTVDCAICSSGYHVTEFWNMWYKEGCHIYEVDVKGNYEHKDPGVCEKHVYPSIRLVKEYVPEFFDNGNTGNWNTGDMNTGYRNTGDMNTGYWNTGDGNTGNWNTGDMNTGHRNTGHRNTGYRNTGDMNTGDRNTGYWNTGDWNTGDMNTGDMNTGHRNTGDGNTGDMNTGYRNTGYWNTGDMNTGYRNTGDWNTGHRNTGDRNTGYWNTGDMNTGFFNTTTPDIILVFNKPCKREVWDKAKKPEFIYFDLTPELGYKGSFQKAYEESSDNDKELLKKLPNFDANVFFEISGIRVE